MSQGDKSTCLIFNILFTLILEILMIDCLINMPSQERKTNLEKRLKEIRQRELKEKGIKPEKTPLDSSQKTLIKETKLGVVELKEERTSNTEKEVKNLADLKNRMSKTATTEAVEIMFGGAVSVKASDIHLEPGEKSVGLRFRIDGVLQNVFDFEKKAYPAILNRIKLTAGLKINIHDAPQDGRLTLKGKEVDIEVRVSVLPGAYGESMVMRLLDPRALKKDLEELGMRSELLEEIKKQLKKTTGAILTTGPTGSGKTTTLYAFLNFVNKPGIKIITIEDPIEYHIKGISQTQVEPEKGYSFASGLRSIVRQDPDVILVGEIRDAETSEIAMHAALTGHLVFSTLHTNDAAGTIPRLIDLGAKPQIIAPAINLAMAQRLVRKLCQECKKKVEISAEEIKKMRESLKNIKKIDKESIFKATGCKRCNFTGYQGRIGIFEAFPIDQEVEKLILKSPAISEIRELIIKKGMMTVLQDGYLKVLDGITDLAEIERILGS
ncbi:MAG: hypothetical protein G01um10142_94 [Parcubacteria group bacterium Gr01-1014_2]|nr:MAG: hypothetical protein G01um10142_94 [Parcubacteria group bacterium Gr01-1014_2]